MYVLLLCFDSIFSNLVKLKLAFFPSENIIFYVKLGSTKLEILSVVCSC